MRFKLKNWKLAVLACIFMGVFTSLGFWQLSRANFKQQLLAEYHQRIQARPQLAQALHSGQDLRFYQAQLEGQFDNSHTLLLDNKTYNGQVGYEIYTPFFIQTTASWILVDRGFIPVGNSRQTLPMIRPAQDQLMIQGMLNLPPTYVSLGSMDDSQTPIWPRRIQFLDLKQLSALLDHKLSPYIVSLKPNDKNAYPLEWKIIIMTPEKHRGYAVQWFALALTLLILFVVLNIQHSK